MLLGLAEAFVHVPLWEQWGLVVNEAAAAGLPLIVSDNCGATAELLVEGRNGFTCAAADDRSIAAAFLKLFALPERARAELGAASRALVGNWGPDRFATSLAAAAAAACDCRREGIRPWDAALMRLLSRRPIEAVA